MLMEYLPLLTLAFVGTLWIFTLGAWRSAKDQVKVLQADAKNSQKALQETRLKLRETEHNLKVSDGSLKRVAEARDRAQKEARVSAKCEAIVEPNKRGTFYWHIDFEGKTRASSTHKTFKTPAEPRLLLESMFPGIKVKVKK